MKTPEPRECAYCQRIFPPTHHRQKYCRDRCSADATNARNRVHSEPRTFECCVCHVQVSTYNPTQTTCAAPECAAENRRITRQAETRRRAERDRAKRAPDNADVIALLCSRWGRAA